MTIYGGTNVRILQIPFNGNNMVKIGAFPAPAQNYAEALLDIYYNFAFQN